jgi:hypothetical protein
LTETVSVLYTQKYERRILKLIDVPKSVTGLFDELVARGEEIKNTCKKLSFGGNKKTIDPQAYEAWKTSCLTLLRSTFGTSSPHYDSFSNLKFFDYYNSTLIYLGILQSAKDDIRKGYFYHKDLMLSVNIFISFLARARTFEEHGHSERALGLLGAIALEALRKLAESKRVSMKKTDKVGQMAAELLTDGVLNQEYADKLMDLERFLESGQTELPSSEFSAWNAWLQKFIYENLGSQIVIVN